ncbi:protein phosphatase 1H [Panulirus ornatus]|uniref:protein phosphatase 1H n=1 Tax=Panulirus ornatus TaxID=150431 RepID=UPI003A87DF75
MLNRFKTALYNVVGSFDPGDGTLGGLGPGVTSSLPSAAGVVRTGVIGSSLREKSLQFPYTRPHFLQLGSEDEIQVTADHTIRPIICPRDISRLPWKSGYAETINAGKSKRNEDQAVVHVGLLTRPIKVDLSNSQSVSSSQEKSSRGKSEPIINGNDDETEQSTTEAQEQTVLLSPQGSTLSASPATELKEDYYEATSTLDDSCSSNGTGGIKIEHSDTVHNIQEETQPSQLFNSPQSQPSIPKQPLTSSVSLPYYLFGVFDGHAGWGAAVAAANQLHHIIHEKLCDVIDILIPDPFEDKSSKIQRPLWAPEKEVTVENAVTGALENAFWHMDNLIGEDKLKFELSGGCTACVSLFIHGKLYVANAGDSRGVLSQSGLPHPMSFDFTPESETQRIRKLGAMHPELLGGGFTHLDFIRRPQRRDIGKRVLYRDHYMSGWAYKTLTPDDLKYPLVCGEGKRSRVLATIGVTRGFGDHDLKAQCTSIPIKPFLTPEPEVRIFDVTSADLTDGDVLILATDGLWDITSNEKAVATVVKSLTHFPAEDQNKYKYRYTSAAHDLVMGSRGKLRDQNWRTSDDKHATIDDISVFVIPLKPYKEEYQEWTLKQEANFGVSENASSEKENTTNTKCDIINPEVNMTDSDKKMAEEESSSSSSLSRNMDESVILEKNLIEFKPQEDYFKDEANPEAQAEKHSTECLDNT